MPGLDDLIHKQAEFDALGVKLLVVVTSPAPLAKQMVEVIGLPYPLWSDPDYRLFAEFQTGYVAGPPMPAWVVGDADGTIRYVWRVGSTTGGLASYEEADDILAEIRKMLDA